MLKAADCISNRSTRAIIVTIANRMRAGQGRNCVSIKHRDMGFMSSPLFTVQFWSPLSFELNGHREFSWGVKMTEALS